MSTIETESLMQVFVSEIVREFNDKKVDVLKSIYKEIGLEWTEENWRRTAMITRAGTTTEEYYLNFQTPTELHLVTFDIEYNEPDLHDTKPSMPVLTISTRFSMVNELI